MKGLELARGYFEELGAPMIEGKFPEYVKYAAAGLAGEGSECFGFDDAISRDHDFGPGFCIWLPQEIYEKIGADMQKAYDHLPAEYGGYVRSVTPQGKGRVGVMPIEGFYRRFTGIAEAPADNMQWFVIPERYLATAVNGEVFCDPYGKFSRIRTALQGFYPEDVLKKKIANRVALMAQSGQYNYFRCMKRGEEQGAYMACAEFARSALSCIYLINHKYMPFYKWAFRGAADLTQMKPAVEKLTALIKLPDTPGHREKKEALIEEICAETTAALAENGFAKASSDFLLDHGEEIMKTIEDEKLRSMHIMADVN